MDLLFRLFILGCGFSFSSIIIYLLAKRRINEKHSLLWLATVFIILLFSAVPSVLDRLSALVGISYPPALLFMLAILTLLFITFYQSMQLSVLNGRVRELAQRFAISNMTEKGERESGSSDEIRTA